MVVLLIILELMRGIYDTNVTCATLHVAPLSCLHSLLPVSHGHLYLHFLQKGRKEALVSHNGLVQRIQCSTECMPVHQIPCTTQQGFNGLGMVRSEIETNTPG